MARITVPLGPHIIHLDIENGTAGDESITVRKQHASGDFRYLVIKNGGGHVENEAVGSLPSDIGLEVDSNGYAVFRPLNG